ncbi:hypothetical protein NM208_g12877 [Fusarium decemcellulare]|uniref:Uncharacterized protein n=1 Tax=Fusarium decemcellulare TaxID=57161 RepID=A0ACC1RN56_9HYPO|nr:hypothetical protein NM208_g12877 [Fusarium decemcellulare]
MAHPNAAELAKAIPSCVSGCFNIGVAATGCDDNDYNCWCYEKNHETVVDTMTECLDNRERKLDKSCTDDEMFEMENSYWKICEQYWETYGTATEPTAQATAPPKTTLTSALRTSATATSIAELPQSTDPSQTAGSDLPQMTEEASNESSGPSKGAQAGIGIGVGLGAILIAIALFLWWRERRQRYELQRQLQAATDRKLSNDGMIVYEKGGLYEIEGDRPHCEELRGDMRTPELNARPMSNLNGRDGNISSEETDLGTSLSISSLDGPRYPGATSPGGSSQELRPMSFVPGASREDLGLSKRAS